MFRYSVMIALGVLVKVEKQKAQFEKFQHISKRFSITIVIILLLITSAIIAFNIATNYIWMDSLQFSSIYTTLLYSKLFIGLTGFILFFLLTFFTLFFIRYSYMKHFSPVQLPKLVSEKSYAYGVMLLGAAVVGIFGSMILQSIGWEPVLKFLNYSKFDEVDPYFGLDVSFYMFVLPFVQFIIYTLLNMFIFFLIIQLAAYSVFHMYRISKHAQIHLASTIGIIGILLALI